jgi:hypothetical protein
MNNEIRKQRSKEVEMARRNLVLGLLFEFGDEASTDTIETGEETAPDMFIAPEIVAGFRVEDGEIRRTSRGSFVVIGDGILGDVPCIVDRTGLAAREKDVAAFVRVGGEKEYKVGMFGVVDEAEFAPLFELGYGAVAYGIEAGSVEEVDGFGVEDAGRLGELFLCDSGGGAEEDESEEKGETAHRHLREMRVLLKGMDGRVGEKVG